MVKRVRSVVWRVRGVVRRVRRCGLESKEVWLGE